MNFRKTVKQKAWQNEVRSFLEENVTPELREEMYRTQNTERGPLEKEFVMKAGKKGWNGLHWPKEYGGLEKTAIEQLIFIEELRHYGAPMTSVAASIIAPSIFRYGTNENKRMWLPPIIRGEIDFALGYSEPNAGTDLASLQCQAVLDGEEWVINGQKTWNTRGHRVTHQWVAVRTNTELPKHKGISLIIVPNETPGVTIVEQRTWGDHRTNEVFFEDVRVPKNYLIGEINKGWFILTSALDHERVYMGSTAEIKSIFENLVRYCKHNFMDGELIIQRPEVQMKLAELEMELEVARLFGFRAASMIDAGQDLSAEASMMKVYATELYTKVADYGMQILEYYGQLNRDDELAPLGGKLEHLYRLAPYRRFGGGTNEVQRNIIAQRGMGLPR